MLAAGALAVLALAVFAYRQLTADYEGDPLGKPRTDFRLLDTQGRERSLSEWEGKVLVVNFWATWCPPCRKEIPDFVALQEAYGAQGVQFVGIAVDELGAVRAFMKEQAMNYPVLLDRKDSSISYDYGNTLGVLPFTVVIDRTGKVAAVKEGRFPKAEAEAAIRGLL